MKILVLGAGAIGGYYGARLIEAGADVTFLVREGRRRQLESDGLRVKSPLGDFSGPVRTATAVGPGEEFDLVILACKAFDLHTAADAIVPAMASGASVIPFLNGLGVYDFLDANFGRRQVLGGVAYIATALFNDGVIRHLAESDLVTIGPRAVESVDIAKEFHSFLAQSPGQRTLTAHVEQALWDKWVLLASGAALCCLMRATVGQIMQTDKGRALTNQAIDECVSVAIASGFAPSPETVTATKAFLLNEKSDWAASMMRDIAKNCAKIEHEAVVGDMIRCAVRLGLAVPLMETAYAHLQAYSVAHGQPAG